MTHQTESSEMDRFNEALRQVVQVSKEDLKTLLAKDKSDRAGEKKRGPKPRS